MAPLAVASFLASVFAAVAAQASVAFARPAPVKNFVVFGDSYTGNNSARYLQKLFQCCPISPYRRL